MCTTSCLFDVCKVWWAQSIRRIKNNFKTVWIGHAISKTWFFRSKKKNMILIGSPWNRFKTAGNWRKPPTPGVHSQRLHLRAIWLARPPRILVSANQTRARPPATNGWRDFRGVARTYPGGRNRKVLQTGSATNQKRVFTAYLFFSQSNTSTTGCDQWFTRYPGVAVSKLATLWVSSERLHLRAIRLARLPRILISSNQPRARAAMASG